MNGRQYMVKPMILVYDIVCDKYVEAELELEMDSNTYLIKHLCMHC